MTVIEWILANWEIVGICFGILVNAVALVYSICRYLRMGKVKAMQNMKALVEAAREYELQAEQFGDYSSVEKLNYVLTRLRVLACELGCEFDEEAMVAQIESDIAYSKGVNASDRGEALE
ncbi:MAG: hypothetical protein IJW51_04900 [Clostridia bacterium]|nr:hypothetical protein [Clostridia bacterium]MBQ9802388.1 hypothetical protein [Clostridia bacterium]